MSLKSCSKTKKILPASKPIKSSTNASFISSKDFSRETSHLEKSPRPNNKTNKDQPSAKNINPSQAKNIQVTCRIRPRIDKELEEKVCLNVTDDKTLTFHSSQNNEQNQGVPVFMFDKVFTMETGQEEIYDFIAKPILESVLEGYNGTILTYGAALTGKTFTLQGPAANMNPELRGIVPRVVNHLFEHIKNSTEIVKFTVKFSAIELQNEKIKDLLKPERVNLKLREDRFRGVCIESLSEATTNKEEDIFNQLKFVERNKSSSVPSKSHLIMIITIRQTSPTDSNSKVSKFYLADLAGTEKIMRASDGTRLPSTNKSISRSLSALGTVINVLAEAKQHRHVPFRYSTLTRILKDSLGGTSKTSLVITCSPSSIYEQETLNTLKFGSRAKLVKNIPRIKTELTVPQLQKLVNKTEKEIDEKNKRIEVLENILRDNGLEVPIESRTDNSSIMDSRSDMNLPSIIGDLESHPESEIFDKEDYLSNRSLFDFSNIQDYDYEEDEPYEETKQDIEGDEDLENALNRIRELESALGFEKKNLKVQLDKVGLLRKELSYKDEQLKRREKEVNALLLKMEYMKLKIGGLEEEHVEKDQQMEVLEELRDTLLNENETLQRTNEAFAQKLKINKEYIDNLSNLLNSRLKDSALEAKDIKEIQEMQLLMKEKNYAREISLLKEENEALKEENQKGNEEYRKLKEDYERFLNNYEESVKDKFPDFEEFTDNMVKAGIEQFKASSEKEKSMLQKELQKKVKKILELENQLEAERTKSNKFLEEIENEAKVEKKDSSTPAKLYVHTECENSSKENIPPKETLTPSEKPKKKKGIQDKGKYTVNVQGNKSLIDDNQNKKDIHYTANKVERKINFNHETD